MKSRMIISFMVIAIAAALIGGATTAWFTDQEQAMEQTFTAGILDISTINNVESLELPTIDHMNPGDEFGPFEIEIVNEGNKKLFWVGDWEFEAVDELDDRLLDALYIKEMKMVFLDKNDDPWYGESTNDPWYKGYYFIKDGKAVREIFDDQGNYNAGEFEFFESLQGTNLVNDDDTITTVDVISLKNFISKSGMLPGTVYEHMGALKPGNKYKLTVKFGFLKEAGNHYQGTEGVAPINIRFTVYAMQVNKEAMDEFGAGSAYDWANTVLTKQP